MKEYLQGETRLLFILSKFIFGLWECWPQKKRLLFPDRCVRIITCILLVSCRDASGLRGGPLAPHRRRLERAAEQLDALRQPRLHRQGAEPSCLPEWDGDLLLYNQTASTRAGTSGVVLPGIGPAL